ncbi:tyrosine-type recombinase/integrase [Maritimibacter alkaliphilus]|uniref:tyrosine-type recombinase/integrase n=1 Tax=Maritimibacter alkaliphilus TaxID=404236 RepID=UPI001C97E8E9|nr:integrase family protein [Maritimibacter alkaliphilus]MBY6090481.1 integrase family protein [Maritimibacter alkaliphilus]
MPRLRLTRRAIDEIPFTQKGQVLYRDTMLPGFGLRVGAQSKVYFAEGQVNRRTRRVTIGRADVFAPEVARKKALTILGDMAEGHDPNAEKRQEGTEKVTLELALQRFLEVRTLSAHTVSHYQRTERLYLKTWRKKPLNEITRQMVLKMHQDIGKKHGETTANNVMRHFRPIYNFVAATQDDFPPNPVQILTQARAWYKERRRQTVITALDLPAWWEAVMEEPEYSRDFLLTALFTGMRRGELTTLRWENVDLKGKVLNLPTTKNGDPLHLPLSEFLAGLLAQRREANPSSPWVFPGPGKSGHLVETKKFLLRVSAGSGVSFTLHDLRRTFITIAESLDVPYYALKRLLNHRTNGDVTGGYIVVNAERLREPVELVAKRILELKEGRATEV